MRFTLIVMAVVGIAVTACKAKKVAGNECAGFLVSYEAQVKPIIDTHCAKTCHSAESHAAGIDLSTYENVKAVSGQKRFMGALNHQVGYSPMPKKAPQLGAEDLKTLSCWVSNGSPK